jgi:hypothetical protein
LELLFAVESLAYNSIRPDVPAAGGYTDYRVFLAAQLGPEKFARVSAQSQALKTYLTNQSTGGFVGVRQNLPANAAAATRRLRFAH